jgi:uncharacterized protein (TIGR03000 family)
MFSAVLMVAMTTADVTPARCHGCGGCRGCWGCHGCWGGCYGGCWGGCYGGGCYGGCYGGCFGGGAVAPKNGKKKDNNSNNQVKARATLIVKLPKDATLTINNKEFTTTSGKKVVKTRLLRRGKKYYYKVRATAERDGQPLQVERKVRVRAGKTTRVSLKFPEESLTSLK